ncbi:MAG: T9SS type A sorting domain-containing protein [Lewinellaceae bacterium]|nr:T9SS type A sorting domain-containing protein [Lewinellaceae bacterium]
MLETAFGIPVQPRIETINSERGVQSGRNSVQNSGISIAPNPANADVALLFNAPETTHQSVLEVIDITGREVQQFDLSGYTGAVQHIFSIIGWPAGIYFARLSINGRVAGVEKLTVIH